MYKYIKYIMVDHICQILLNLYYCSMPHCINMYKKLQYILSVPKEYYKQLMQYLYPTMDILFIKNNNIFHHCNYSDITNYQPLDYDYMIYNKILQDKTLIKIINHINQSTNQSTDLQNIDIKF